MKISSILVALVVVVVGCTPPQQPQCDVGTGLCQYPPVASPQGGDFMPAYLDMLRGINPGPADACRPQTAQQLLLPCDKP